MFAGIIYLTACCMFKTRFSEEDLKWLNPYKEGDTLIFRSAMGDMDTSWIVQKVIYYPECNPIAGNAKYKYQTGRIFFQNSKLRYSSGGKELISIVKHEDRTDLYIFYINSGFSFYDLNNQIDITYLTNIERLRIKRCTFSQIKTQDQNLMKLNFYIGTMIMVLSNTSHIVGWSGRGLILIMK